MLDRDGTIIVERHYLSRADQVELLPGAAAGLQAMRQLGFFLVVLTNQSGIGRNFFQHEDVWSVHERLRDLLRDQDVELDGIYYCPHVPEDGCRCRKPSPGLVERAAADLGFAPAASVVIGDKSCDIDLGRNVGATTILTRTGYGSAVERTKSAQPDYVIDDLLAAARLLEHWLGGR